MRTLVGAAFVLKTQATKRANPGPNRSPEATKRKPATPPAGLETHPRIHSRLASSYPPASSLVRDRGDASNYWDTRARGQTAFEHASHAPMEWASVRRVAVGGTRSESALAVRESP